MSDIIKKYQIKNIIIGVLLDIIIFVVYLYIKINFIQINLKIPQNILDLTFVVLIISFLLFSVIFLLIPIHKIHSPNNSFIDIVESGYLSEEALCADYKEAEQFSKYRFGTYCIFIQSLYNIKVVPVASVIWIYCNVDSKVIQEYNRVKLQQKFIVHIYTKDKKQLIITVPRAEFAEEIMSKYQNYPFIVFGYTKELMKKYKKNFDEFLEIAYNE